MCGIVASVGNKNVQPILLQGLKRLEYRGYDSAGMALLSESSDKLDIYKQSGRVAELEATLPSSRAKIGIAHTRWATHGSPNKTNAHPHFNRNKSIAIVHNGIIENHRQLRQFLQDHNYQFKSQTDSEVIAHLLDYHLGLLGDPHRAFVETVKNLEGSYGLVALFADYPDKLWAVRKSSPMVIGHNGHQTYIASDASPMVGELEEVYYPEDDQIIEASANGYEVHDLRLQLINHQTSKLEQALSAAQKQGYPHFMLKEIHEIPEVVKATMAGRLLPERNLVKLGGLEQVEEELTQVRRLIIVACGTSYYAALAGALFIEEFADIAVEVEIASEFRYRQRPLSPDCALLAVSQSGETADTLEAVRLAKDRGILTLGLVNVVGSSIARLTDAGVYTHAGPEISVASTKAFVSQVVGLYLIGLYLTDTWDHRHRQIASELASVSEKIETTLGLESQIKALAKKISKTKNISFLGRRYGLPIALEGSLKLKEISYIHSEGIAAGELKHGPIALLDKHFPVLAIDTGGELHQKLSSNIIEAESRGAPSYIFSSASVSAIYAKQKRAKHLIVTPDAPEYLQPIVMTPGLHLLAYYVASDLDRDIDKPRNLAKSVTVE